MAFVPLVSTAPMIMSPGLSAGASGRAGAVNPIEITHGLEFADAINARSEALEPIVTGRIGHCSGPGRLSVGRFEDQRDSGNAAFAGIEKAVVVEVAEHETAQAYRQQLAEVVIDGVHAGAENDLCNLVAPLTTPPADPSIASKSK